MNVSLSSLEDTSFQSPNVSRSFITAVDDDNNDDDDAFQSPLTTETDPSLQLSNSETAFPKISIYEDQVLPLHKKKKKKKSFHHDANQSDLSIQVNEVEFPEINGIGGSSFTETESDEIADNQSIISDTSMSLLSSHHSWQQHQPIQKPQHSYEKLLHQMKKLKNENMKLKETLTQANVNDITLLKTKLRGAQADILRYKQLNNELKERIQSLENKIFTLLSEKGIERNDDMNYKYNFDAAEKEERDNNNSNNNHHNQNHEESEKDEHQIEQVSISQKLKKQFQDKKRNLELNVSTVTSNIPAYSPVNPSEILISENSKSGSTQSLVAKCRHYEKLLRIYEKNMSVMQNEIDRLKHKESTPESETSPKSFEDRRTIAQHLTDSTSNPTHASSKSVDFQFNESQKDVSDDSDLNFTTNGISTHKRWNTLSKDMKLLIDEYRANDQKTIKELANEVKRLSKLLPRKKLNDLDAFDEKEGKESSEQFFPSSSGLITVSKSDSQATVPSTHDSKQLLEKKVERNNNAVEGQELRNSYSFSTLLFAFCTGCFLMFLWLWRYLPS